MQAVDAPYISESTGHVAASGHAQIELLDDRDPGVGDDQPTSACSDISPVTSTPIPSKG
jgi:hypothetical protein